MEKETGEQAIAPSEDGDPSHHDKLKLAWHVSGQNPTSSFLDPFNSDPLILFQNRQPFDPAFTRMRSESAVSRQMGDALPAFGKEQGPLTEI